ncbi:hypothetical protein ACHAWX_003656 [Stephanocyclus meneghinianus]
METSTNKQNADSKLPFPDDSVSRFRAKAVAKLPPETNNSIRALIVLNQEILDRCMESKTDNDDPCATARFTCRRKMFNVVKTRSVGELTEFLVFPRDEKKEFDITPLVQLPPGLNLFQPLLVSGRIDFGALFETFLLLHDDILLSCLSRLKDHLQSVQVCLGTIEQWLVESRDSKFFLEATFATKLDKQRIFCHRSARFDSAKFGARINPGVNPPPTFYVHCQVLKQVQLNDKLEASFSLVYQHERAKLIKCLEFASAREKIKAEEIQWFSKRLS